MDTKQIDKTDDLNELLSELENTKTLTNLIDPKIVKLGPTEAEKIDENNIDDFIFRKSSQLIQQGIDTVEVLKSTVMTGSDSETIEAYSKLMTSVATSLEILNKINIQKRKEKSAKELKQMDIDTSKKLLDKYDGNRIQNQTNIVIASREEVMQALIDKAKSITNKSNIIDVKEE